jgi:activator of HSP90 ATPase
MSKEIKQQVTFDATPHAVYDALLDSKQHAAFTGDTARASKKVGARFRSYGTYIEGVNVELVEGKRIVQAWRASDWPKGAYSIATFSLDLAPKGKTKLVFTQTGVPNAQHKSITQGWKDYYWKPMKLYFASKKK